MSTLRAHRFARGRVRIARLVAASLLIVGVVTGGSTGPLSAVARRDGDVDTTFASSGVFDGALVAGTTAESVEDVVVLSDDSVVTVGSVSTTPSGTAAIVRRITSAGAVDTSFGTNGRTLVNAGFTDAGFTTVARDGSDRIVAAGRVSSAGTDAWMVARFLSNGSLDLTFSGDGTFVLDLGGAQSVQDLSVLANGSVLVLCTALELGFPVSPYLVKLDPSGTLDVNYGPSATAGRAKLDALDHGFGLAIDEFGSALVVGSVGAGVQEESAILRVWLAGRDGFGGNPLETASFSTVGDHLTDVIAQADGSYVAVGVVEPQVNGDPRRVSVLHIAPAMVVDLTKGDGNTGRSLVADFTVDVDVVDLAVGADGRPVLAVVADGMLSVLRLAPGVPPVSVVGDPSFGSTTVGRAGSVGVPVPGVAGSLPASTRAVAVDGHSRVVVAGNITDGSVHRTSVARVLGDTVAPSAATIGVLPKVSLAGSIKVSWSAIDANSGVASFDVRSRSVLATSKTFAASVPVRSATVASSAMVAVSPGRTICFSARARDRAGNVGAWGVERCTATPVNERALTRTGTWTQLSGTAYYRGTALRSSTAATTLVLPSGDYRGLSVVVTTCSSCGSLAVYRGGTLLKTISLRSATTVHRKVIAVQVSSVVQSGDIRLRQMSAGKPVIVEGLLLTMRA